VLTFNNILFNLLRAPQKVVLLARQGNRTPFRGENKNRDFFFEYTPGDDSLNSFENHLNMSVTDKSRKEMCEVWGNAL